MNLQMPTTTVKIGVVPMEQDLEVSIDKTGEIRILGGIEGKFIEMLSTYVSFVYQPIIPRDGEWGTQMDNGSWTGIIGMINKGEIDLGIGYLVMTEERYMAVNFSTPYNIADKTFVTNPPKLLPLVTTFIYPFDKNLWIACLVLLVTFSFVVSRKTSLSYMDAFVQIFGTFCKQPASVFEKSKRLRLLTGSWGIFATIITIAYCGILPSFMTISLKEKAIDHIRDLYEAVEKQQITCLAPKGSSEVDALFHSAQREVKFIAEKIKQNQWFYDLTNGTMADYLQEDSSLIGLRLWFNSPDFATKIVSSESFGVWNVGVAVKNGFCCTERLNVIILRILSAGLFDKLVSDQFFAAKVSLLSKKGNSLKSLHRITLEDIDGVFRLLLFGHSVACFCFAVEFLSKFFVKRA